MEVSRGDVAPCELKLDVIESLCGTLVRLVYRVVLSGASCRTRLVSVSFKAEALKWCVVTTTLSYYPDNMFDSMRCGLCQTCCDQ